ncbi:MAG: hypothetical protein ABSF08_07455 [Candidatus Cybelea sp.]
MQKLIPQLQQQFNKIGIGFRLRKRFKDQGRRSLTPNGRLVSVQAQIGHRLPNYFDGARVDASLVKSGICGAAADKELHVLSACIYGLSLVHFG